MRRLREHSHNASTCPFCVRATGYTDEHRGKQNKKKRALKTGGLKHTHATRKSCGSLKKSIDSQAIILHIRCFVPFRALEHGNSERSCGKQGRSFDVHAEKSNQRTAANFSPTWIVAASAYESWQQGSEKCSGPAWTILRASWPAVLRWPSRRERNETTGEAVRRLR